MSELGVYVGSDVIAIAKMRRGIVIWSAMTSSTPETVFDDLCTLLHDMPPLGWPAPRARVAFGADYSHVKTVRGLPESSDARLIARIVAATPHRFFIGTPGDLVTTAVRVVDPGTVIAGALRQSIVEATQRALAMHRIRRCRILPSAVMTANDEDQALHPAVAVAASVVDGNQQADIHYTPKPLPRDRRRDALIAGGIVSVVLCMAAIVPPVLAARSTQRARAEISALAKHRSGALTVRRELDVVAGEIGLVANFEQRRMSKTLLLAQLSDAMPNSAAITSLKVDSTGGTLVAIAPHASDIVQAVESVVGISHVEIVGAVGREMAGTVEVERATVRFKVTAAESSARIPMNDKSDTSHR